MIAGVDVHGGYGLIDWPAAAAAGIRFGIAKCSEGNEPNKDDRSFSRNVAGMRAAGVAPGGYHFPYPLPDDAAHTGRFPREQAQRAFVRSGGLGSNVGELPHVMDAEWPPTDDWPKWKVTARSISEWLHEYCETATELWGRKPLIYTYPYWWKALSTGASVAWAADYGLWMAHYTHLAAGLPADGRGPVVPAPWDNWDIWQYSAEGSLAIVPGISACPVDRDCIRDEATFSRLLGTDAADTERPFEIVHPLGYDDPDEV